MVKLLYIDLFCGAGGTSTGVESARHNGDKCAKVIACVNHDANAIASHAANHPDALHFTEDIRTLKLSPLVTHIEKMKTRYPGALVVLWASLECTNFSKAKGGQPRDADSRTLADHLFRYIGAIRPDYIQIENVEEFMSWGDLDAHGKPVSRDNGRLYRLWVDWVKRFGYDFDHRILNAADYGAYTSRRRFFGQFAKHGLPIVWPEPTHAKAPQRGLFGKLKKWKPVKDVLDFSDEGESIFTRKKPLSDKTLERIYAGLIKFVAGGKDKWLLKYNSMGKNGRYNPPGVDAPCPVVSTQGRLQLCSMQFLSKQYSGHPESKNFSIEEPAHTVTPVDHHALATVSFIQQRNSGDPKHKVISVERPARTITATGGNQDLVQLDFLSAYYGNGHNHSVNEPCPVFTSVDRFAKIKPVFIVNEWRPANVVIVVRSTIKVAPPTIGVVRTTVTTTRTTCTSPVATCTPVRTPATTTTALQCVASGILTFKHKPIKKNKIMTKLELVNDVARLLGKQRKDVSGVIETAMAVIMHNMSEGRNIYIRGFGSFILKKRATKQARDINRGTTIIVPEHYIPKFKTAKSFADMVKNNVK